MKQLLFAVSAIFFSLPVFSQHYTIPETDTPPKLKNECESDDTSKCFESSVLDYINQNIDIIKLTNTNGGTAYAQFIITEKGEVKDIRIRSNSKTLEKETERLLRRMKIKEPAMKDGKEVAMIYTVPVKFQKKQSNSYSDFFDEQLSQKEIAGLSNVSTPPRIKNYNASLESITSQFKSDIIEKLRSMEFKNRQIRQLKFTFVISENSEVKNILVIVPNENLQKATRNIIEDIKILNPAFDENGNPVSVRLNYQFEDI